ncbi:MAG TPA: RNB domain-containing ribonuclease [Anaerolineae bacterium]|nr:RNB domain-containing ribonuclease [Anaerolineae bacterium]
MDVDSPQPQSLVLYKNRPARVMRIGQKKIEIELFDGQILSVRPKDIQLLHPGPIADLSTLGEPNGEVRTAWELLQGETTNLAELADLAYGEFTPASAWAVWSLVADGLYFGGTPDQIVVHDARHVAAETAARQARADQQAAWSAFLERMADGRYLPEDEPYLAEIVELANGRRERSRVLAALGQAESPENAHAVLLELGYCDGTFNPYPARAGLDWGEPAATVERLDDEPRRDLTHLAALAIDDAGSRDPDDALSLDGHRLWVHIADVGALVAPDSQADLEARERATNLYLPEGTVMMLPAEATRVLGLGLAEVSPALSLGLDIDAYGQIEGVEITPSLVKVTRMTYEEADEHLNEPLLAGLDRLARIFEERRQQNGAINITLPEVRIWLEDGRVHVRSLPKSRSRDIVRDAMLMAGEAVGRYAMQHDIPIPFTGQEQPSDDLPPATTLSEMFTLRRTMRASQASSTPAAHAGLGMEIYVQATSPLRRYLDLVVHQQLRAHLNDRPLLDSQAVMERVGAAEAITGGARWAERRSSTHWTLVYLQQNPDWSGEGVVVDRRGRRSVVLLPDLALESQLFLRRETPMDGKVQLAIDEVDLPHLEAHFRLAG